MTYTAAQLVPLLDSWAISLRAERKSEGTIKTYGDGARPYLAWCAERPELDPLSRSTLSSWITELMTAGRSASTAKTRLMGVQRFTCWLAAEDEIEADPFHRVKPPKVDEPVIPVLSDDELRALIAACQPTGAKDRSGLASLRHRRDEAIVRVMVETGMRASECVGLRVDDVDMGEHTIVIRRGKGGKGRTVAFGPKAALALDRYLRVRRLHPLAETGVLWLGERGRLLGYGGLYRTLSLRGQAAGIADLHPHRLRHTSTDRWLAAGGSEQGAMAQHGWARSDMLARYGRANRERRAIAEARELNLGDF